MDRALRIIGVTLVVGVGLWAYGVFDRSITAAPDTPLREASTDLAVEPTDGGAADGEAAEPGPLGTTPPGTATGFEVGDPVDADGDPPRYLAFDAGIQSRFYRVAATTTAGLVTGPLSPTRSDYPVETDLFPADSLADNGVIAPGLYASPFGAEGCGYELRRLASKGGGDRLIGQERLAAGRLLVSINRVEADGFQPRPECGTWSPWSPLVEPLVAAGDGDYWTGDLARGTWAVPEGCLWEKVVAFRGARLVDVTDSARGPGELVVDADTLGVRLRDCDRLVRLIEAEPGSGFDLGAEPGLELGPDSDPDVDPGR